eukprot:CAMPEP_0174251866 /NCGR_PEP_ID=MMETSP0439-20130205/1559_1 /TAXON_ID=0 /ORGANISM="Stereomyxa ramosa, Strain Chinc5" /LENGTH=746 /DNA_ID=CAMNT_0015332303 /DNA_START=231 /DNA_END=2471 /DNA_ORIENTATION=-
MSLLGADTVNTKVGSCSCMDSGIPRLGIPHYMNLVETNTAVAAACLEPGKCATNFPGPGGLAASFNRTLWHLKGEAISDEMRALNNYGWHRGVSIPYALIGLTGFGPNINIIRDPRFGRNSELPSEDPFLSGSYAVEYVRGCQEGSDPNYLKMISGLKHYDAYSVETGRGNKLFNISMFDLWDTYLAQYSLGFRADKGNAMATMCSYAGVNGVPSCANNYLLNEVIRKKFNRPNVVVASDCGAIGNMLTDDVKYAKNSSDAAAKALNGGCDLDLGDQYYPPASSGGNDGLTIAIEDGLTTEAQVDAALTRVLAARFKTGQFDPLENQPYTKIGIDVVDSYQHQLLNYESALQSFVLLKNSGNTLPFPVGKQLAVVGPHVYSTRDLMSDYKGDQQCYGGNDDCVETIANTFTNLNGITKTVVQKGVDLDSNDSSQIPAALAAASNADYVVLCIGIGNDQEHEGIDRTNISLPGLQEEFSKKILALGKPTVVVLINGGIVAIDDLIDISPAIIEAFYPSTKGAYALFQTIFGFENRWGRLPMTVYPTKYIDQVDFFDFNMSAPPGRTYRYYTGKPLFEFGFGLSYTSFSFSCDLTSPPKIGIHNNNNHDFAASFINITCKISNNGSMAGDEVLMVYHRVSEDIRKKIGDAHPVPIKGLVGFERVGPIPSNQQSTAHFSLNATEVLSLTNNDGDKVVYPGVHFFDVSDGLSLHSLSVSVSSQFVVVVDQAPRMPVKLPEPLLKTQTHSK